MRVDTIDSTVPYYHSTMIGREAEINRLARLIQDPAEQLITLTGLAGVGKTRLIAHVARNHADSTGDEVFFVPLANVQHANLVLPEIGKALSESGDDLEQAVRVRLAEIRGLLVLDNFEQVIDAAPIISAIRSDNPQLTILVTSQRMLEIDGERVVRLDPLPTPTAGSTNQLQMDIPSMQLLIDRAASQDNSFVESLSSHAVLTSIIGICQRLDGIPLAIELAASRVASLSPEAVLAHLEESQQILSSQRVDAPARHQTLHASISWNVELLFPDSRRTLIMLGVFPAGFDLDIVQYVINSQGIEAEAFDIVNELANLSLIRRVSTGTNPWWDMLVSIREFCLEELDAANLRSTAEAVASFHVTDLAEKAHSELQGANAALWVAKLSQEMATIRSVIAWAFAQRNVDLAINLAVNLRTFMEQIGQRLEIERWLETALADRNRPGEECLIHGLLARATLLESSHQYVEAATTVEEIEDLLKGKDLPKERMSLHIISGNIANMQFRHQEAEPHYREAIEIASTHSWDRNLVDIQVMLAVNTQHQGRLDEAESRMLEARETLIRLGDRLRELPVLVNLSSVANSLGAYERALNYLDDATEISDELDHKRIVPYILLNKCSVFIALNRLDSAEAAAAEAIQVASDNHYPSLVSAGYMELGHVKIMRGDFSGSVSSLRQALDALEPDTVNAQMHSVIGIHLATCLAGLNQLNDAAALLPQATRFAERNGFTLDDEYGQQILNVEADIAANLKHPDSRQPETEEWTDAKYIQNLYRFARLLSLRTVEPPEELARPEVESAYNLTKREQEILQLIGEGLSTQAMADQLSISPRTITTHVSNMMAKMNVKNRNEMLVIARNQMN